MGIIARQGAKQSLVHLVGVLVGAISTLFIYPLDTYTLGLARFLTDGAIFLAPFALFGLTIIPVRFFPRFRDQAKGHNGFFRLIVVLSIVMMALFALVFTLGQDLILRLINPRDPAFLKYFHWLLPLALFSAAAGLLYNYCSIFGRIAIPYILTNLFFKIALPTLILLFVFGLLGLDGFVMGLVLALGIPIAGLLFYIWKIGEFNWHPFNKDLFKSVRREMLVYGLFGMLGSMGSVMVFKIDSIMISSLKDFGNNGLFSIGANIANIISAPTVALSAITGPIISQAWHNNDLGQVNSIYRDSSIVLLILGFLALLLVFYCMPDLITLFPEDQDFSSLYMVTLILAVAKVFDMAASVNDQIIVYSNYYKFSLVSMLCLGVINVVLNYYFIAILDLGILGAALATSISLLLFNLIKFIFIWSKMKLQPFSLDTLRLTVVAALVWLVLRFIPFNHFGIVDLILKGITIVILYVPAVYYLKISAQFNQLINHAFQYLVSFRIGK
ncbi:MAG: polysaccharide biosynthesis C-terminal domain-containing protein [Saprospiraceae bacterium]|nr:polysaccharide biosynthesis C-terminal domain-containing protein [Saprospiraceae bacterium]